LGLGGGKFRLKPVADGAVARIAVAQRTACLDAVEDLHLARLDFGFLMTNAIDEKLVVVAGASQGDKIADMIGSKLGPQHDFNVAEIRLDRRRVVDRSAFGRNEVDGIPQSENFLVNLVYGLAADGHIGRWIAVGRRIVAAASHLGKRFELVVLADWRTGGVALVFRNGGFRSLLVRDGGSIDRCTTHLFGGRWLLATADKYQGSEKRSRAPIVYRLLPALCPDCHCAFSFPTAEPHPACSKGRAILVERCLCVKRD